MPNVLLRQTTYRSSSAPRRGGGGAAGRGGGARGARGRLLAGRVVGRVDDPLVLPRAPRVRARAAQLDAEVVGEVAQLGAAHRDERGRIGKRLAETGAAP